MVGAKQSWFLILVRDRAHVPSHHFEIRILADVIDGHLEHAEMEVSNWTKRPARDENDRLLFWVSL